MQQRLLILLGRPSPQAVYLLVAAALMGAFFLIGVPPPTSVSATQPIWVVRGWAAAMLASGLMGLWATAGPKNLNDWRDLESRLRLEGSAMWIGAGALVLYCGSLINYAGWRALSVVITYGGWAVANYVRARQIRKDLRQLSEAAR